MSLANNTISNSPIQTPTGNSTRVAQVYNRTNSSNIADAKQQLQQQPMQSQFEITSISCTTGINNETEKNSTRFRRVKIGTDINTHQNEYIRGRWSVKDYYDDSDSLKPSETTNEKQVISSIINNVTTNTTTNKSYAIPNPSQKTTSAQQSNIVNNNNSNLSNAINTSIVQPTPVTNSTKLASDKQIPISVNTSFVSLATTATLNNNHELINNLSPPGVKNTVNNVQNTTIASNTQDNSKQQSMNSNLSPPLLVTTTVPATQPIQTFTNSSAATALPPTNINNSKNPLVTPQVTQVSTLSQVDSINQTGQIGAPITSNVVIGSANSVFQNQSIINSSVNPPINSQQLQQPPQPQPVSLPTISQVPPLQAPLLQVQPQQQIQPQMQTSVPQSFQQNQSEINVNNINNINSSPSSISQSNSGLPIPQLSTNLPFPNQSSNYQNQITGHSGSATAPILNLSHNQKQPFASQFSSQHVSPKENNSITTASSTNCTQTITNSSNMNQVPFMQINPNASHTNSLLTPSGIFNDYINIASTKTSSSSSSSTNDLFSEAALNISEVFQKKPPSNQDNETEKKNDGTAGIHNRIEAAMDLVKSHLTNAVKEEIVNLKLQIEKLNEKCARLEEENKLLRQHVNSDVLMSIDSANRSTSIILQNHSNQNIMANNFLNQTQSTNYSSAASASSSSSVSSSIAATNVLNHNISATMSPSALSVTDTNLNTSGDDNSSISEILAPNTHTINSATINNTSLNTNNSILNENSSINTNGDDSINNKFDDNLKV